MNTTAAPVATQDVNDHEHPSSAEAIASVALTFAMLAWIYQCWKRRCATRRNHRNAAYLSVVHHGADTNNVVYGVPYAVPVPDDGANIDPNNQNYIVDDQGIRRYFIVDKYGKIFIQDSPGGPMRPATVDETQIINETLPKSGQPVEVIENSSGKPVTVLTALRM